MIIPNPCVGVCKMHPTFKVCIGCYRSPLQLRLWNTAPETTKLDIVEDCDRKKELYGRLLGN